MDFVNYLCEKYKIGNIMPNSFEMLLKNMECSCKCEFDKYAGYSLCMPYFDDKYYMTYSNNMPRCVEIYTSLHEIGHILLGHLDELAVISKEQQEQEARIFSTALIALILWEEWKGTERRERRRGRKVQRRKHV